jgi:hypothetical protein
VKLNVNIITQYTRTVTGSSVTAYTSGVAAHVGRDWEAHAVVRVYENTPYYDLDGNGEVISTSTMRAQFTVDMGTDVALAIPVNSSGVTSVSGLPPIIITQPQSGNIHPNQTFYLSVFAISDGPITYQWYFNGGAIAEATGPNLVIPDATTEDNQGEYYVTCTNDYGTTTSVTVNVSVQAGTAAFGVNVPTQDGGWFDVFVDVVTFPVSMIV